MTRLSLVAAAAGGLFGLACKGGSSDKEVQIDPAVESARTEGRELFFGLARCADCHAVGSEGNKVRGPNLAASGDYEQPVVVRAKQARPDLEPIEYLVEATLAPDVHIVKSYKPGVMSPPDEEPISLADEDVVRLAAYMAGVGVDTPVTAAQLELAKGAIDSAKSARQKSRGRKAAEAAVDRIDLAGADKSRGDKLYKELQCARCHEDPESEVPAPTLDGIEARLSATEVVRWLIAPPEGGMPSFGESLADDALRDLVGALLD